jgi:hypothetical protein
LFKIPQKKSPCRNRGRLPKLTAYEKIFIALFTTQISDALRIVAVKALKNAG